MERDRLFNKILSYKDDRDDLGMIISNNIDLTFNGNCAISSETWSQLIDDILRWHEIKTNITMRDSIKW